MIELKPFTDKKMVIVGDRKKYSKVMKSEMLRWSSKANGWPIPMNRAEYFEEFIHVLNNKDQLDSIKEHGDSREIVEEPIKRFHRANSISDDAEEKLEELKSRYSQSPGIRKQVESSSERRPMKSVRRFYTEPSDRVRHERPLYEDRYSDRYERYDPYYPRYPPSLERSHGYIRDMDRDRYERDYPRRLQDPYELSPRRGYEYRELSPVRRYMSRRRPNPI